LEIATQIGSKEKAQAGVREAEALDQPGARNQPCAKKDSGAKKESFAKKETTSKTPSFFKSHCQQIFETAAK